MSVPDTITNFMRARRVEFDTSMHPPTATASQTAQAAHVPGDCVAKAVVLDDGEEYVMAVIPSTHRIDEAVLEDLLHCELELVDEPDLEMLFRDCRPGAVPAIGNAYGIATVVDDALLCQRDVYFEGGDHERLVHVTGDGFDRLMVGNKRGRFSRHV
jgi:Ala-tRNA(Pro) deacylase